jgi:FMN phosphatase YigB (HAD superfamily)
MNIIFDYNRTLFDPENGGLYESVYETLEKLSKEHKLFLFSYNEFGRDKFMKDVHIDNFFSKISLVENKDEKSMSLLIKDSSTDRTFVVGDSLRNEISIGNKLGYETIWLRKGKFAFELPRNKNEEPSYIINSLGEIFEILKKY